MVFMWARPHPELQNPSIQVQGAWTSCTAIPGGTRGWYIPNRSTHHGWSQVHGPNCIHYHHTNRQTHCNRHHCEDQDKDYNHPSQICIKCNTVHRPQGKWGWCHHHRISPTCSWKNYYISSPAYHGENLFITHIQIKHNQDSPIISRHSKLHSTSIIPHRKSWKTSLTCIFFKLLNHLLWADTSFI